MSTYFDNEIGFHSSADLFKSLLEKAHDVGFSLRIIRSDTFHRTMTIGCDRGGLTKSTATMRKTKTKKTNCLFLLKAKEILGRWRLISQEGYHNHELVNNPIVFPRARRLTEETQESLKILKEVGVAPRSQISYIKKKDPNTLIIAKDIYNEQCRQRQEFLAGRTPIQALFDVMKSRGYYQKSKTG